MKTCIFVAHYCWPNPDRRRHLRGGGSSKGAAKQEPPSCGSGPLGAGLWPGRGQEGASLPGPELRVFPPHMGTGAALKHPACRVSTVVRLPPPSGGRRTRSARGHAVVAAPPLGAYQASGQPGGIQVGRGGLCVCMKACTHMWFGHFSKEPPGHGRQVGGGGLFRAFSLASTGPRGKRWHALICNKPTNRPCSSNLGKTVALLVGQLMPS